MGKSAYLIRLQEQFFFEFCSHCSATCWSPSRGAIVTVKLEPFAQSYYQKLWIDDVMKKAAYPSA